MRKALLIPVFLLAVFTPLVSQEIVDISSQIIYNGKSRLSPKSLKDMDSLQIDFQLRGICYAFSSKQYAQKSNGEAHSSNIAQPNNNKFNAGLVGLYLSENEFQKIADNNIAHTLYLINTSEDKISFHAQDSRLSIVAQVKNKEGEWTSITYLPSSSCGNSYHTITLGPDEYWEFAVPIYKGDFKTKLRYTVVSEDKIFVSNEIDALVSLGQLNKANKQGHNPQNIMDPYSD